MVMEWEAESDEPGSIGGESGSTGGIAIGEERAERLEASPEDLVDAVGRVRRARFDAANLNIAVAVDEVIFEPSF